jgi:hypothetical protein
MDVLGWQESERQDVNDAERRYTRPRRPADASHGGIIGAD